MTDLKRTIKCSNCGNEANIYLSSELDLRELLVAGKCNSCGSTLQLNFGIVGEPQRQSSSSSSDTPVVNIDESLFTPEIPSDTLRDLMDD